MALEGQRQVLDIDRVVRHFYNRFKGEQASFLSSIQGLSSQSDREAYSLLMLNRLMFLHFMQQRGFLDGDRSYLSNHLEMSLEQNGQVSFYRDFLLPLFQRKLGTRTRQDMQGLNVDSIFGKIPALHCSLFDIHELEHNNAEISIANDAFVRLFAFFNEYRWNLDERAPGPINEITPDILGYIFEQYINQRQMGAYYTKKDITEYIARNSIILHLFSTIEKNLPGTLGAARHCWQLLQECPDRYIFASTRCTNRLPVETEQEYAARHTRYSEIKGILLSGKVRSIEHLITYNLDIRRFALDVIESCEEPDLLRAFYNSTQHITVLDPTCGSGAFLLAALDILEPLYVACLSRMQAIEEDANQGSETKKTGQGWSVVMMNFHDRNQECHPEHSEGSRSLAREILRCAQDDNPLPILDMKTHNHASTEDCVLHASNSRYCILRSILINNLYGVDIMQEAVEICKLRLLVKLLAHIEQVEDIRGLPSIDRNILSGNALVGFVSYDEANETGDARVIYCENPARTRLDHSLAGQYGIDPENELAFEQWKRSHRPFHWCFEFERIMRDGGFDVIMGNPPYIEYNAVKRQYSLPQHAYKTEVCGNLYALCMERFVALGNSTSTTGLIVPLSLVCTGRMAPLRHILYSAYAHLWLNNYDTIPSALFAGIVQRNTIVLAAKSASTPGCSVYTTKNQKRYVAERPWLFEAVPYIRVYPRSAGELIPKVSTTIELSILDKIGAQEVALTRYIERDSGNTLFYKRRWSYFLLFADSIKDIELPDGSTRRQQDVKTLSLQPYIDRYLVIALLSSGLFYFHYSVFSDFRHVNITDFATFQFDYARLSSIAAERLSGLGRALMHSYTDYLEWRRCNYIGSIGECRVPFYRQGASKAIIDEIDCVLAGHYGFTEEELAFIISYDLKYRMRQYAIE